MICFMCTKNAEATNKKEDIAVNTPITSAMEECGDSTQYYFTLTGKASMQAKLEYDGSNEYFINFYSVNADGTEKHLYESRPSTGKGTFVVNTNKFRLPAGKYCVKIAVSKYGSANPTAPYTLTLNTSYEDNKYETENNDSTSSANVLPNNTPMTGNLSRDGSDSERDIDYYKISLSTHSLVQLLFKYDSSGGYFFTLMKEMPNGEVKDFLSTQARRSNNGVITKASNNMRLPAGNYYIKIAREYALFCNADYQITANVKPEDSSYESEFNDGIDSANPISIGKSITGNLTVDSSYRDDDVYTFTLTKTIYGQINFKYSTTGAYKITLQRKTATGELETVQSQLFGRSQSGVVTKTTNVLEYTPGEYYVTVCRDYALWTNEDYTLTVNKLNLTPKKATLSSLKSKKKKVMTVKWKKDNSAMGYEIQYSTNSKFKKANKKQTIVSPTTSSLKISGLKSKKNYYVRVRSYYELNDKKIFGSYSNSKKVKIK